MDLNFFIIQNCNLRLPIIYRFKNFKQNLNDSCARKHYITSITCEFQKIKIEKI